MKERPILFSAPMVRAILDGSKTQTRRIVKFGPEDMNTFLDKVPNKVACCPYGQPGDQLWVRETFSPIYPQDQTYNNGEPIEYDYAATYKHGDRLGDMLGIKKVWKPSIHMPRAASRILLEATGVRVERLQDIGEADAIAEGIEGCEVVVNGRSQGKTWRDYRSKCDDPFEWLASPICSYQTLWEQINGAGSWDVNPWVWAIEFKRVDADAMKQAA